MNTFEELYLKRYQRQTDTWNKLLQHITEIVGASGSTHKLTNSETSKILQIVNELARLDERGVSSTSDAVTQLYSRLDLYLESLGMSNTQITHFLNEIFGEEHRHIPKIKKPRPKKNHPEEERMHIPDFDEVNSSLYVPVNTYSLDLSEEQYQKIQAYADKHFGGNISEMFKSILTEEGII